MCETERALNKYMVKEKRSYPSTVQNRNTDKRSRTQIVGDEDWRCQRG
jgi:hypothetical protein